MTEVEREEHRLAALAAGYDSELKWGTGEPWFDSGTKPWKPKTNKADSFELLIAIGKKCTDFDECSAVEQSWQDLSESLLSGDASVAVDAIFNCAVEIGRAMEVAK